jgi:hypothetical protein
MTRAAIRRALSALAAVALVSAIAAGPVSAGNIYVDAGLYGSDEMFNPDAGGTDVNRLGNKAINAGAKPKIRKGLATRQAPRKTTKPNWTFSNPYKSSASNGRA